ncbi:MAG: ABC transporter ATP-binding protein [Leptonema sp. (in: Bacteria)]|nr:ABC transporter ATP-binding protein [Leptonema sp. (in: bacteria)]
MAIQCTNLSKSFGEPPLPILKGINITIQQGEFVALTGRSGSGKSTLLYILSGLDEPTTGKVYLHTKPIYDLSSKEQHEFRNEHIGFVFQFHYLLPELTAIENILMPARKRNLHQKKRSFAEEILAEFGLEHCRNKLPSQMSGGEGQRCAIARSLIMQPSILFTDEPTGNLDTANGDLVINMFKRINKEHSTTILMVTHDLDYAQSTGRQIHLVDGEVEFDKRRKQKGQ